jgi:histone-lysine N-methyltransferase SUV420H
MVTNESQSQTLEQREATIPEVKEEDATPVPAAPATAVTEDTVMTDPDDDLSDLSDMSDTELAKTAKLFGEKGYKRSKPKKKAKAPAPSRRKSGIAPPPVFYEPVRKRFPGDYMICDPDNIECVCADCTEKFFHDDRWYVPRSCKRCERHSKIFGLIWPKTLKRKNDDEVRLRN